MSQSKYAASLNIWTFHKYQNDSLGDDCRPWKLRIILVELQFYGLLIKDTFLL